MALIIDPERLDPRCRCKLLICSVVPPRPIAWTSTVSREGVRNLAPFSFLTVASRNPPMLCISVGPREERPPDTKDNPHKHLARSPLGPLDLSSKVSGPPNCGVTMARMLRPFRAVFATSCPRRHPGKLASG